jgi:hypothetical protein
MFARAAFAAVLAVAVTAPILTAPGVVAPAWAGPDEIVTALTGTPATLFDLGLARIEAFVGADGLAGGYSAFVHYQDREILVLASNMEVPGDEAAARALIQRIKRLAGVDPVTGFPDQPASAFASMLSFGTRIDEYTVDPTYMETLDSMFRLKAVLGVAGNGEAVVCSGKLLSPDVVCVME